jgi:dipeptidase E
MKKLFLSSEGLVPETKKYFFKILGKYPKDTTVAFIPTAADPQKNKTFVQWSIDQIKNEGMKVVKIDLKEENKISLYHKLKKCDVIWLNGGNTYYLLDKIKKSGFDKIINKLLESGKIYFGVSAGSYVACPNIEAAGWKHADRNINNLKNLTGLNFVPFIMTAHFEEAVKKAVEKGAKNTKLPVVALTDKQALIVKGKKYKVVGIGKKNFYNGFKENW